MKGEDTPSAIGEVLKIPDVPEELNTLNETDKNKIDLVNKLLDENKPTDPEHTGVNEEKGKKDEESEDTKGYKRPTRNAGFGLQQPMLGNVPRVSPRLQPMHHRYPLPYRALNRFGPRRFGPGQWNQGYFRPGPYPIRPGSGPMNQNPGFWQGIPQRPMNFPVQFGGPRYPQGPAGPMGRQPGFAGLGDQNENRFGQDPDGIDINLDLSFPDFDQNPWLVFANFSENDQGAMTAQVLVFQEVTDDNAPEQPHNEVQRPRL